MDRPEPIIPRLAARILASLMPLDPGLLRFSATVRTSLSTIITALLVVPALLHTGQPLLEAAPIVLFPALAGLFARDSTLGRRQVTLAYSFLGGAIAFGIASALAHWPIVGPVGLLLLLGGLILLQMRGPRIVCIGLTTMVGFYLGLFVHPPLVNQSVMALLLLPALALSLLMMRLLPDDPGTVVHLMLASVAAQADRVVFEAAQLPRDTPRLERHLMQLNRAIIAAQAQLTLSELPGSESTVGALINLEVAVTHAVLRVDAAGSTTEWRDTLHELARAAAAMGRAPALSDAATGPAAASHAPLAWRSALRATCAGVIATAIGYPLSPEHWYWAIISVLVISTGTFSVGDTLQKGILRLIGTTGGALAGFGLAAMVPSHPVPMMVVMAICLIGWSYFVLYNYALGIAFLTLLIGLTYGVLGHDMPEAVWIRLLETAIGAVATFVTAMWLVPLPTSHHVRARALTLIARLVDVIDVSRDTLAASQSGTAPLLAMRRADQAMQDLRTALQPLRTAGRLIALIPRPDALPRVMVCVHWVRVLAVAAASEPALSPEDRAALLTRLERLRDYLAVVGVATFTREPAVATSFTSVSATLIAEAADRIEAALVGQFGRHGATPGEFARAFLT